MLFPMCVLGGRVRARRYLPPSSTTHLRDGGKFGTHARLRGSCPLARSRLRSLYDRLRILLCGARRVERAALVRAHGIARYRG